MSSKKNSLGSRLVVLFAYGDVVIVQTRDGEVNARTSPVKGRRRLRGSLSRRKENSPRLGIEKSRNEKRSGWGNVSGKVGERRGLGPGAG